MKLILALFLCGAVYATALPTCSEMELYKCGTFPDGDDAYMESEAFLDDLCRSQGCLANFKSRCDITGLPYQEMRVNLGERIYNAICGKKNKPMRQKYLENARCMVLVVKGLDASCPNDPGQNTGFIPNYCRRIEEFISCTTGTMSKECGSDAREVFEACAPDLKIYGC